MRFSVFALLSAGLVVAAVVFTVGGPGRRELPLTANVQAAEKEREKSAGPPPLVVDKTAPLLLDEPPEKDPVDAPLGPVADNSACHVCHTNYEEEPFAVSHAEADVGCVECHGKSYPHRNDEDNVTPPDVIFPPEKIKANCATCHDTHDAPAVEVIARWQQRCPAKSDPKTLLCTDCHGQHRLKLRTVRWDKTTRRLILREKDPRIQKAPDPNHGKPETGAAAKS